MPPQPPPPTQFSSDEVIAAGHHFFGSVSRELALIVEKAVSQWGLPNGYILGEEAGGAFIGGLRYGDGTLYTKNAGDARVYWQGPSLGFDYGADGARTMMLVYNLPRTEAIFRWVFGVGPCEGYELSFGAAENAGISDEALEHRAAKERATWIRRWRSRSASLPCLNCTNGCIRSTGPTRGPCGKKPIAPLPVRWPRLMEMRARMPAV